MSRLPIVFITFAPLMMAQNAEITWVRAAYLKDKAGAPAAEIRAASELANKGAAANIREGVYDGFVRMRRVLPTVHQTGHDVLYLYFSKSRPNLTGNPRGDVFLKAVGLTADQWAEKRRATAEPVNLEVWSTVFQHGSIKKGDTVRVGQYKADPGELARARSYWRDWGSAMRAGLVQRGIMTGAQLFEVRLVPENAPYHFIGMEAYPKGDGPLQSWGNQQEGFLAAHPGKDYHAFREAAEKTGAHVRSGSAIYRVEEAIWK